MLNHSKVLFLDHPPADSHTLMFPLSWMLTHITKYLCSSTGLFLSSTGVIPFSATLLVANIVLLHSQMDGISHLPALRL